MKIHRFFSPEKIIRETGKPGSLIGTSLSYSDASGQWKKVLRLSRGEQVTLFDGSGYDIFCEILDYQGETVTLKIIDIKENSIKAIRRIIVAVGLVKKDTFEWIVQKVTELGVTDIIPILADRSEKKNINVERLQKIIIEAAEQSGRGDLPTLHGISTLQENVSLPAIVFDLHGKKFSEMDIPLNLSEKMTVFIGPEGGWTETELGVFEKNSIPVRSLGPQVLRTETAVVAALSHVVF